MDVASILLYQHNCHAKDYLKALLATYPFDIEEQMVFSLLKEDPYPYPALLNFIDYVRHVHTYHIIFKQDVKPQLDSLYTTMCKLSQRNQMVLYTHQFKIDATLHANTYNFDNPYAHLPLNDIAFIDSIQLHIPATIDMDKQTIQTIHTSTCFMYRNLSINANDYLALSIQIADCHGLVFLPKKYISLLCACGALYQICAPSLHNDFFLLYGVSSQTSSSLIYEDIGNELTIGLHSGNESCNQFQTLKDMISTLYSCHCMKKRDFPLHGSMIQLHFPQKTFGVLIIGVQGTGKSSLSDSLYRLCDVKHIPYTKVFHDQGVLHNLDNDIYASGSEIGAYLHIDALPQTTTYKNLSASVLIQEQQKTTHVILPFTSIEELSRFHKVDIVFYLDNTIKQDNLKVFDNLQECYNVLYQGKSCLKNTKTFVKHHFWGSLAHAFNEDSSALVLHEFLTMMYVNDIDIISVSTYHRNKQATRFYDKKALQLYQHLCLSIYEKEDCEKA